MTRALAMLDEAGVPYHVNPYELGLHPDADTYAEAVADALGVDPRRLFKTLVAEGDRRSFAIAVIPAAARLREKSLAKAAGWKQATLSSPRDAERLTGYQTGGISPFGRRTSLPVFVDSSATSWETILVSAGRRGLQVEVDPAMMIDLLDATVAGLT